jgi:hypothetical protein
MDRATLVTGFLCAATLVAYADEVGLLIKAAWRALLSRGRRDLPPGVLDLAMAELTSADPERIERGAALLRMQSGTPALTRLLPLLAHADPGVSRRAAQLLYERQDPAALEALYWFHARNPAH